MRRILIPFFGSMPLASITPQAVEVWRTGLRTSARTRNKQLTILNGIFRRACKLYGVPTNPVSGVARLRDPKNGQVSALTRAYPPALTSERSRRCRAKETPRMETPAAREEMTGGRSPLAELRDRIKIEEAAIRFGRAADNRRGAAGPQFDACMTEDVEIEYPFRSTRGVHAFQKAHAEVGVLKMFTFTRHVITNSLIEIDGDRARAQYYVSSPHGVATDDGVRVVWGGGVYTQELVRTPAGWRISKHVCTDAWMDDPEVLASLG